MSLGDSRKGKLSSPRCVGAWSPPLLWSHLGSPLYTPNKTRQLPETGGAQDLDQPSAEALPLTALGHQLLQTSWPNKQETYDKDVGSQGKKGQSDLFSMSLG